MVHISFKKNRPFEVSGYGSAERYIFMEFTKCINLIPSILSSKKPPGSMLISNVFLTGRRGHSTKLVLWDYHLSGQPTAPLKIIQKEFHKAHN